MVRHQFTGPPLRKVVVVGSINSVADGRVFEDLFAQRLRAAGVEGIAGYTVIADEARVADAQFASAVANTGAQGLLLVRLLGVDTRTQVSTTMVSGGMGWGSGPWAARPGRLDLGRPKRGDGSGPAGQPVRTRDRGSEAVRRADSEPRLGGHDDHLQSDVGGEGNARLCRLIIGQLASRAIIQTK